MTNLDKAVEMAEKRLLESGELMPMFHAFTQNDESLLFCTPWRGEKDKVDILHALRLTFQVYGIKEYFFFSEVWMAKMDEGELEKHRQSQGLIQDRSDRIEALIVYHITKDKKDFSIREMIRDESGKITGFRDSRFPRAGHISGRMSELLPENPRPLETDEKALALAFAKAFGFKSAYEVN